MPSAKTSFARPNFLFIMADQMAGPALPTRQYVRSSITTSTTLTKGLARYPYMEPVEPDFPRDE